MDKLLATIAETGAAGGWGRSTTYKLLAEGKLEGVRVGKRRLIVVASLQEFVASLRGKAICDGVEVSGADLSGGRDE